MNIGKINSYKVTSQAEAGHYIQAIIESEATQELDNKNPNIFMPYLVGEYQKYSTELTLGQEIEAFVYQNVDGDIVASLLLPHAQLGEFALLRVVDVQDFGAFLDWGLEKDLFVSAKKQSTPMNPDEWHLVLICLDHNSGKIYGTTKFGSYLESLSFDFKEGDKVDVVPVEEMELGFRCIINKKYLGMIYYNEIFVDIEQEETYVGHVKKIREDGLLDVALQVQGIKNLDLSQKKILETLKASGGKLDLHDKSTPQQIKEVLGMSKKTFKNSIGMLYKSRRIAISSTGLTLVEKAQKKS